MYVATPLPPLNFNQIGKICPIIAKWQRKIVLINSILLKYKFIIINGTIPLIISRKSTINAKYLFPVLRTLVAPTFPEPIFLISPNPNIFVSKYPKGIDPKK